jgi:multidrug resistance protein, MATE family
VNNLQKTWQEFRPLVVPMMLTSLTSLVAGAIDAAIVGHLGVDELAAVSASAAILSLVTQAVLSCGIGYSILGSRAVGASRREEASSIGLHVLVAQLVLSVLGMFVLARCAGWGLSLMSTDSRVSSLSARYLSYSSATLPLVVIIAVLRTSFDIVKKSRLGMYVALLSTAVDAASSYTLAHGVGPFPAMGLEGAALGTVLGYLAAVIFLAIAFLRTRPLPAPGLALRGGLTRSLSGLALPELINMFLDYGGNLIVVGMIARLGTTELAVGRLSFTFLMVFFLLAKCFGSTAQILIGHELGKESSGDVGRLPRDGARIAGLCLTALALPLLLAPKVVLSLFTSAPSVLEAGRSALWSVFLAVPLMGAACAYAGALRAHGQTKWVMYTNVIPVWLVQIPIVALAVRMRLGIGGVYGAYAAYFAARAVASRWLVARLGVRHA